jgi:hypothetical protein
MALSEQQFQDWLESNSAIRCTLVEVTANIAGTDTTIYLSNIPYNTNADELPANTMYLPILKSSLDYTESLPTDGTANLSYGDIAVNNINGEYDHWMDYVWVNRPISIYVGDIRFPREDFYRIYSGVVSDLAFSDNNTINISIRSLLEKLNTPITDARIGGTNSNADTLRPLMFGEVHNITPIQFDPQNLVYMVHNGPIERIIEVRDNGVPLALGVSYTENLSEGTFTLLKAPSGTITCSVQGEQNYINANSGTLVSGKWSSTVAEIILLIINKYGTTPIPFDEIDLTTFIDYSVKNTQKCGIYLTESTNVIVACQELADSIGAQFTATRGGLVTLAKIDIPNLTLADRRIGPESVVRNSFSISSKTEVVAAVKLAYCKNWTVQTQLLTGLPEEHKLLFSQEYLYETAIDTNVQELYKVTTEPEIKNTLLISNSTTDVTEEAQRMLALWSTPRYIYAMELIAPHIRVKLGEYVLLKHPRFGLSQGKPGQVISVNTSWQTGRVKVEVLV